MENFLKKAKAFLLASLLQIAPIYSLQLDSYSGLPFYDNCGCDYQVWADAEYLYWIGEESPKTIPFVVSGPSVPNGTPLLGNPNYKVVLGNKTIDPGWTSGARASLGVAFDPTCCFALEANYLFLPKNSNQHTVESNGATGSTFLAIPYFDVTTNTESSVAIARPGTFSGKGHLELVNKFQGAELNGLMTLFCECDYAIVALAGFRWWNFDEYLQFRTNSKLNNRITEVFRTKERFHAENNFYGGQIGLALEYNLGDFFLEAKGKLALGAMSELLRIRGELVTNAFNSFADTQTFEGGYFALPTNIGHSRRTKFGVLPEININLGYMLCEGFRFKVGYTFMCINDVLRAAKTVDRQINPTQSNAIEFIAAPVLFGSPSPRPISHCTSSLWLQGFSVGVDYQF